MARVRETCKLDDSYFEFVEEKFLSHGSADKKQQPLRKIKNIDKVRNLIRTGDLGSSQLSKDCGVDTLSVYRKLISRLEANIRAYEREYKLLKDQKRLNSSNPKESLMNSIAANTAELQTFTDIANKVTKTLNDQYDKREALERSIDFELREISSYEYKYKTMNEDLSDLLLAANTSYFELNKLSRFRSSFLFNISTLSSSSSKINNETYGFGEINGFRLSFFPVPQANLNWSEINAAWATIALAVVAAQNRMRLSQYLFSFGIQPLRRKCYLFRRVFGTNDNSSKSKSNSDIRSVLCLEGGSITHNDIPHKQTVHRKSIEEASEYTLSVLSLALVLRQTLSALARDRTLPLNSILSTLNSPEDAELLAAENWSDTKKNEFIKEILTITAAIHETRIY